MQQVSFAPSTHMTALSSSSSRLIGLMLAYQASPPALSFCWPGHKLLIGHCNTGAGD